MDLETFWKLSYGIYVVASWDKGRPVGCIVNSAMQITAEAPTIAVSINHDNYTHQCISESGKFSLSILAEDSAPSIIGTFGFYSGRELDKFEKTAYRVEGQLPILTDSCGYLVCEVVDQLETDTHTVFLAKVLKAQLLKAAEPMTYAYYHKVIKGKSPKNAPTYLPDRE